MRARELSWLWLAISTAVAAAQDASGSGSSNDSADVSVMTIASDDDTNSTTSGSNDDAVNWFQQNFDDGETRLVAGMNDNVDDFVVMQELCSELPSVQTYNTSMTPNGGCPDELSAIGASCTCLTDYNASSSTTWSFKVKAKTASITYPLTESAADALEVDRIETMFLPKTVTSLSIVGVGDTPQSITFVKYGEGDTTTAIPAATTTAGDAYLALTTLEIVNIDFYILSQKLSSFVPSTVTNLTLRNCNITQFSYTFLYLAQNVTTIDLSNNNLVAAYGGSTIATSCSNALCAVEHFNISKNKIATMPTTLFNLEKLATLDISKNLITDFNISRTIFDTIAGLSEFVSDDAPSSATCSGGTWQAAHNVTFCVLSDSVATTSTGSNSTAYIIYAVVGGCIILVVLLYFVIRPRRSSDDLRNLKNDDDDDDDDEYHVHTNSFDDSHGTLNVLFTNDPIIVMSRVRYKDLKLGRCLNKGGFGEVFLGDYNGRQVAIKRIRLEFSSDVSQIELFMKEISLIATLIHPRIVEFIGVAWDSLRHLSAVTEYMDRGDLRDVLHGFKQRDCRLTWNDHKLTIALHIAEALTYLHSLTPKVIHRDLKSKNILLNCQMDAKLSDFGISRERRFDDTHMTAGIGTSFWIAPEVLLGKKYDERADVFSFGIVLSEIDTDDYPYWNDKNPPSGGKIREGEILRLVAKGAMRPEFTEDCPKGILELADACLQADPLARPIAPDIAHMLQLLTRGTFASTRSTRSS